LNKQVITDLFALRKEYPGFSNIQDNLLYLMCCGSFDQFCSTLRALLKPSKYCPFCNSTSSDDNAIAESGEWLLRGNDFPNKALETMLLIVPKRHLCNLAEMTLSDWSSVGTLTGLGIKRLPGGALVCRFGDPHYHAGTIPHTHFNIYSPRTESEYRFPLSKTEIKKRENYQQLLEYRQRLTHNGGIGWLFS
jgi:diadenosine tetraphosphate (Ap4A) HIT family hydrolase